MIGTDGTLIGTINVGTFIHMGNVEIKQHYLDGTNLILVLNDDSTLTVDISEYIVALVDEKVTAIENMQISMETGELIIDYDDSVLDYDFYIEDNDLIVNDD